MATRIIKRFIKKIFHTLGIEITTYTANSPNPNEASVSLKPQNGCRGNVLLALWIKPFFLKNDEPVPNTHAHYWRSLQIAHTFLDMGYCVDVIDYLNREFIPQKKYDYFVSFRTNLERIARRLNEDCIKIVHLDTVHWLFNNYATFRRGLELQQRKGVTLKGLRIVETNMAIEHADYGIISGNEFTISTYSYLQKSLFHIPYPVSALYQWPDKKDFNSCRKNFLWFGSSGFVHKGLDLVLDVFSEMPGYHLYVCGPIQDEKDFEKAYYTKLYQTPNIHTLGWVDIEGAEFIEVVNKCIGLVYPSCAEGGGGSVLTCMHTGLIPIVSFESSVDVEDFGIILKGSSLEEINKSLQVISSLPSEKLKQMSRKAWEFARANHTRERYSEEFRKVIEYIMKNHHRTVNHDRAGQYYQYQR